jgi:DNA-binding MltR family transcriptional regulator
MSPRSEALSEIQRLLKTIPDQLEIISKIHQLETDCYRGMDANATRSAVLVSVGFLEHGLAAAIGSFLTTDERLAQKMFDGDGEREGILGTIYTRNIMAHALNIYGPRTFSDVTAVKNIRNLCAHAKSDIDFASDKLKPLAKFHAIDAITAMRRLRAFTSVEDGAAGEGKDHAPSVNPERIPIPLHRDAL